MQLRERAGPYERFAAEQSNGDDAVRQHERPYPHAQHHAVWDVQQPGQPDSGRGDGGGVWGTDPHALHPCNLVALA